MNWDGYDEETAYPSVHRDALFPADERPAYCHRARQKLREEIAQDIYEFVANGGQIIHLPYRVQTPLAELREQVTGETWKDRNERHRKTNAKGVGGVKLRSFDP